MATATDSDHFKQFGFMLLRGFFDPGPLSREVNLALADSASNELLSGGVAQFQYVPLMTNDTPHSWRLFDRAQEVAEALLKRPVIPTRVKAIRYSGDTAWHSDSVLPIASIGCLAYLDPLSAKSGALQVIPGSHHRQYTNSLRKALDSHSLDLEHLPTQAIETDPGDLIVFDEHLYHSSYGGSTRHQWRIDFLADPKSAEEMHYVKAYYAGIFPPDWNGNYNVERFPCYGPDWQQSNRDAVARLKDLGVYELANKQEEYTRLSQRRTSE